MKPTVVRPFFLICRKNLVLALSPHPTCPLPQGRTNSSTLVFFGILAAIKTIRQNVCKFKTQKCMSEWSPEILHSSVTKKLMLFFLFVWLLVGLFFCGKKRYEHHKKPQMKKRGGKGVGGVELSFFLPFIKKVTFLCSHFLTSSLEEDNYQRIAFSTVTGIFHYFDRLPVSLT